MLQLVSTSLIGDTLLKHVAPLSTYIISGLTVVTLSMYIFLLQDAFRMETACHAEPVWTQWHHKEKLLPTPGIKFQ